MTQRIPIVLAATLLVFLAGISARPLAAQAKQGPLIPPPDKKVVTIPTTPAKVEPPPIPAEEIIRSFAQKEEEFLRARGGYTFRKTVRVVEFGDDGAPAGSFQFATEARVSPDGGYSERMVQRPQGALPDLMLQPEDLDILWRAPLFPFTPGQLAKYEFTYAGKEQVDELSTYLFQVKPRQVDRAHAYFDGVIWVDDRDLCIVKVYGKWVTETGDVFTPEAPFVFFETYRENVDGKYWFPSYVRSDAGLKLKDREAPLRLTVRWTDFKALSATPPQKP
jgi:hypothetical protein